MPGGRQAQRRGRGGRAALAALGLAVALAGGCREGAVAGLEALGVPTLQEVPADRARRAMASGDAVLVQRRGADERLARLPGATMLGDDETPPAAWRGDGHRHLVAATERRAALALAARLRRAGVSRVGVVTGDLASLGEPRTAAAQPTGTRDHRTAAGRAGGDAAASP